MRVDSGSWSGATPRGMQSALRIAKEVFAIRVGDGTQRLGRRRRVNMESQP
jgi:hypothetical protein